MVYTSISYLIAPDSRAHPFFLERAATLKGHDSNRLAWKDVPSGLVGKKNIVAMTRRPSRPGENHDQVIVLPSQFSGFLDSCRSLHRRRTWQNRFGWYRVQRLSGIRTTFIVWKLPSYSLTLITRTRASLLENLPL
ncbi:hypothetical protein BDV98DRAFT_254733 [Pterulicium gracile]|uniref:Uncharacterized protein n=1 Tax=Pterulicium gracile TaxID=1884261 RepID=A0A5C3Q6D9_9AGAR|nr:hypothetical protein BDV98DRAFT_254733 [Pterula gracilis]